MTVKELFDHFNDWFYEINYCVSPVATSESGVIKIKDENDYEREESQSFLEKFGEYIVMHWEYIHYSNSIYLLIKEK